MATKFQQRHYEAVADTLYYMFLAAENGVLLTPDEITQRFVRMFDKDNERFKESKFRKACGL